MPESIGLGFYVIYHIPIWDRMEREISDALLPVAFSAAWMLVAKKYVLPVVSSKPTNQPFTS